METVNPYQNNSGARRMLTVVGVCVAMIVSITVASGNSILLPVAAQEIGGEDIYSLAATMGGIVSLAGLPLFGFLGAKYPRVKRSGFVVSFLLGAVTLSFRVFAPNIWFFIIPSILLGVESAALYTFGYGIVRDCFDRKQAGVYLGLLATMLSVGILLGPVFTGSMIELIGWRVVPAVQAVFFVLAALLVFLGARITKEAAASASLVQSRIDLTGAVAITVMITCLILVLSLGSSYVRYGSLESTVLIALGVSAGIVVVIDVKKKKDGALIPSSALRSRNTLALAIATFFGSFCSMALTFFLPMFMIYVLGVGAGVSSIAVSLFAILGLILSPIFGRWVAKIGTVKPILVWFAGVWRALLAFVFIFVLQPGANVYLIYALMFIAGLYNAATTTAGATAAQIMIEPRIRQQANGVIQIGQNFGGVGSIAIFSSLIAVFGIELGLTYSLWIVFGGAIVLTICGIILEKPHWIAEAEGGTSAEEQSARNTRSTGSTGSTNTGDGLVSSLIE